MARKSTKITTPVETEEQERQTRSSLFDYLRFGESYTSLVLGIIVVIISTVLLLSFVNNRNSLNNNQQLLSQKDIALPSTPLTSETPAAPQDVKATNTPIPTKAPVLTQKVAAPTTAPTKKVDPTKAPVAVAATATPTQTPAKIAQGGVNPSTNDYTVAAGDNLWTVAEKQYKSGYNWVDIARANNLSNPGLITTGQKLKMPKVEQKIATTGTKTEAKEPTSQVNAAKITGDTYKTAKGDTLWGIAIRAYGDGYQWSKIANANKLTNPSLIHSGNNLKIPRGK